MFKITIISFSKGKILLPSIIFNTFTACFQCCKDTRFVCQFDKGSSLTVFVRFKRWLSHTSFNTEASTEVTSYLFCIVYDPICQILVRPGALDTLLKTNTPTVNFMKMRRLQRVVGIIVLCLIGLWNIHYTWYQALDGNDWAGSSVDVQPQGLYNLLLSNLTRSAWVL